MPGCDADGSCSYVSTAPLGDETVLVLEGAAGLKFVDTAEHHEIGPGSVVIQPKGCAIEWTIRPREFKALWIHWESRHPASSIDQPLVARIDDDAGIWEPYEWVEPQNGLTYSCGEMRILRDSRSRGTLRCGIWRSRPSGAMDDARPLAACRDGRCAGHRIGSARGVGDETMLILEGHSRLVDEDSGERFELRTGDVVAVYEGLNGRWTSEAPDMMKFWVVTQDAMP